MNTMTAFSKITRVIVALGCVMGLILVFTGPLAQARAPRNAAMLSPAAQVVGPQDPILPIDFGDQQKVIVVRLGFSGTDQVSLDSAKVIVGQPHVRLGDPPQLRIRLLGAQGQILDEYNAWNPLQDSETAGDVMTAPGMPISGRFVLPFSPDLTTMEIIDILRQKKLTSIDVRSAAIRTFCELHQDDQDCRSLPPSHRATDSLISLYTFEEGNGSTINDVSGTGAPLNLQIGDTAATQWTSGGLTVISPTLLVSNAPAAKMTDAISATGELTLESWVRPAAATQANDGSIVALATDTYSRDLELSQLAADKSENGRYEARLRTSATSARGQTLRAPRRSLTADLTHVVLTRDALGITRLYVNGVKQDERTIKGDLSSWIDRPLALANDLGGNRSWLGEYQLVALYNRALSPAEVGQNFRAGPSGDGSMPVMLGLHARYAFDEGSGTTIHDTAAVSIPLDLQLHDASAAQWTPDGLAIIAPTMLVSAGSAARVSTAISATGEVTLETWVQPAAVRQQSLARIATLSDDSVRRNIELIQEREEGKDRARYTIRLRTSETARNAKPPLQAPQGSVGGLQHVVYTRDAAGLERIYINGIQVARDVEHSDLSNWDQSYRLVLANTLSGDRPWLGEYRLFAIYNRALSPAEVVRHFQSK